MISSASDWPSARERSIPNICSALGLNSTILPRLVDRDQGVEGGVDDRRFQRLAVLDALERAALGLEGVGGGAGEGLPPAGQAGGFGLRFPASA